MLSKKYSRTAFVLSCILGSLPVYAAPSEIENIPEGFRGLWDEQDELLEVRLYGRSPGYIESKQHLQLYDSNPRITC